jgi:hypothetical protein
VKTTLLSFRLLAATAGLCGAAAGLHAQPLDGLYVYLQYQVVARSFKPDHYFFLPDGRYMNDAPQAEISKAAFEAGCQAHPKYCGTYKLSGTTLTLTGSDGKPSNSTFKTIGPDKAEIFGVPATKVVRKFTANTKLNGRYSATGGYGSIMSARAYEFRPDGTFSFESVGAVRASGMGSAVANANKSGTYRLNGNSLELTINGQLKRLLAYDMGNLNDLIMIEGEPYTTKK